MWIIAIAMRKGGTGKTSTVVNLAGALAARGRRALVLDLDPQHNATDWFEAFDPRVNLAAALINETSFADFVRPTPFPGVECLPASPMLALVEGKIAGDRVRGHLPLLERCLHPMGANWDYLLIDCPPSLGILSLNALRLAHRVIAPAPPDAMSLAGLEQLSRSVDAVKAKANPALVMRVLIAGRHGWTRHAHSVEKRIRERYGAAVYKSTIRRSVRMAEAWEQHKTIAQIAPRSPIAKEFDMLADEVEQDTD